MGENWFGNYSISQDLENYPYSEIRKDLPRQPPSLQDADLSAVRCFILVDAVGMRYKFSLEKYWNEDFEISNGRELISGVQIYLHLGF